MKKNIVAIGGGAGTFNVLYGLKKNHDCNLSAIILLRITAGQPVLFAINTEFCHQEICDARLQRLPKIPKWCENFLSTASKRKA